jgi:hypothetical protein
LADEIGGVEEGAFLGAYVDEGSLDSREHGVHPTQVNVTDHASVVWTIDEKLNELPILQNRDPRFARSRVDEDFSFQLLPVSLLRQATRQAKLRTVQ